MSVPERPQHPMWYILHLEGVWCKGKRERCYKGNIKACKKCKYYNRKGVN